MEGEGWLRSRGSRPRNRTTHIGAKENLVADVLVDEFDGWLDEEPEQPAPRVGSPLDLPTAPRRIKRTDA